MRHLTSYLDESSETDVREGLCDVDVAAVALLALLLHQGAVTTSGRKGEEK